MWPQLPAFGRCWFARTLPEAEEHGHWCYSGITPDRMAARGHHRAAGVFDLLTAAVAEHRGAVVMHYDADFEHIAATTGRPQQWIVPRGSLG